LLEKMARDRDLLLIHGAINQVFAQVAAVEPQDDTLSKIYSVPASKTGLTLSYIPAVTAGLMVNEAVKAVADTGELLSKGKILSVDFLLNSYFISE